MRVMVLIAVIAVIGASPSSLAQPVADPPARSMRPTAPEARRHWDAGNGAYKLQEFAKALEHFKLGASTDSSPGFEYNLAQCYRQLGQYSKALWHYERFRANGDPQGELLAIVDNFIAKMRLEVEREALAAQAAQLHAAPVAPPVVPLVSSPAPPAPEASFITTRRKVAIGLAAAGVVAVGVGVVFGVRANGFDDDAREICPSRVCDRADEARAFAERGRDSALVANIGYGVGAAAVVAATALWFLGTPSTADRIAIVPTFTSTSSTLCATGRF